MPDALDGSISTQGSTSVVNCSSLVGGGNVSDLTGYQLTQGTFGKMPSAMSIRILGMLTQSCKAVGYILCGNYKASCWLLAENVIITCQHVFTDIDQHRSGKTNTKLYEKIYVNFEYVNPDEYQPKRREIDEEKFPVCTGMGLDYTIRHLKPIPLETTTNPQVMEPVPLLWQTRSKIPQKGHVILAGHPGGLDKCFVICEIVPKKNRNDSLRERAKEAAEWCQANPVGCPKVNGSSGSCVHDYGDGILKNNHLQELAYHTSFYHGSSGSPVFNEDGHIIAMHTSGYPYKRGPKQESLMEFALPIKDIYEDMKKQNKEAEAKRFFPHCFLNGTK